MLSKSVVEGTIDLARRAARRVGNKLAVADWRTTLATFSSSPLFITSPGAASAARIITPRRYYSTPPKPSHSQVLWVGNSAPRFSNIFTGGLGTAEAKLKEQLSKYYIAKVVWSPKQQGCYLHFSNHKDAVFAQREINKGSRMKAFMVEGDPFVEDLLDRTPSLAVQVKFKGTVLNNEEVYTTFRKYGRLRELQLDEKNLIAKVIFESTLASNAARNCAHQKKFGETLLDIEYTPYTRWKIPVDLLTSPRAIVPIAGILVSSFTLLLNPIRLYFVTQRFTVEQGITFGASQKESVGHPAIRTFAFHSATKSEEIFKTVVDKKPSNVLLMVGPKGTTKSSILRKVMQRRMFSVRIDCSKADSVAEFMELFVKTVGFRPSFTALNTLFSWFSSFVPAAIAPSIESQLMTLLLTIDRVLIIARTTDTHPVIAFDEFDHFLRFLESENKDEAKKANGLLKLLTNWAALTTKRGDAHVVFVTNSVYSEDSLRKTDGLKSIPVLHLHDVTKEEATAYIKSQFNQIPNPIPGEEFLGVAIDCIGGRQGDLDQFLFLISNGFDVIGSTNQMMEEAKKVIRRRGFGLELFGKNTRANWTQIQLWKAVKLLQRQDFVKYDNMVVTVFEGNESALQGLVENNILSVDVKDGIKVVSAFSPLYLSAFRDILSHDTEFVLGMDKFCKEAEINKDLTKIEAAENEMVKLGRVVYHEYKLGIESAGVQKRLAQLDKEMQVLILSVGKKKEELADVVARQAALALAQQKKQAAGKL